MMDYKQNALIQDLKMKDVICTKEDWILRGRLYYRIPEHRDNEGQELYISMEGVPLREPEITVKQIILQLHKFPIYSLGASNTMIGKTVSNAFDVIAPPARVSVFWLHELQRTEAVFQNMLSTNRHAVGHILVLALKRQLTNF